MNGLYKLPQYYDIAFTEGRDIDTDTRFFIDCFQKHAKNEVKSILEAACGSGAYLTSFPRYGYRITGYDISPEMVQFSQDRILSHGMNTYADAVLGDMRSIRFAHKFDAALTLISSLSYCTRDDDLKRHFALMSDTVRSGGIYIVEIFFICTDIASEKMPCETWSARSNGTKIDVLWRVDNYDYLKKIRTVTMNMCIKENGSSNTIEEKHFLRLWYHDDFLSFVREAGFRLEAAYNQSYQPVPVDVPFTGELGALYLVLVKE
ncbi:class I SAM-dependent methyltransferase [bacterium]|nr:class I SAM-dependent methyltransferase [bacterium]